MNPEIYNAYVKLLHEELVPAMGCTEPIAIAYASALARDTLGATPDRIEVQASGNLIKNVKSVVVPNTNGLKGIEAAVAAGVVAGNAGKALEVISEVSDEQKAQILAMVEKNICKVSLLDSGLVLDLIVTLYKGEDQARVRIINSHTNVYALFQEMGKTMLLTMGGASGVIFGTMFMGGAKGKPESSTLNCVQLAELMADSLAQIKERGKAQVGDKTMVDALEPAAEAMKACAEKGDLSAMLAQAAEAARQGMENTKNYQAKYGRAKSLMERAMGHQDAGATSTWIIFRSMNEFVEKL